ncbi:lysophospholipid acyltransferase family protein [bacterium]|nr:lysophospholipid acyltransferase family protein [bacterium]
MITADHKKWADWIFQHYLNGLFKRHFNAIYLLDPVPDFDPQKPILLLPNHSSWWDGFFVYLLNKKRLHRKIYMMMLEEQLKQNRFFRLLGAYSIMPGSFKDVKQSLQYTMNLLNRKEEPPLVCFYPQGELLPWHTRPIVFGKGLEWILKKTEAELYLCFLGIRIEFLNQQRAEVFIQFSSVKSLNQNNHFSASKFESEFMVFLDQLEKRIINGEKGKVLFRGKKSVNEQFQAFRRRGI